MSESDELDKRDTLRDANSAVSGSGNTLRGLNNGAPTAEEGPPSSGMGPVIVPGVREPPPVEAPPMEPPPVEQVALEKKSSVPRLLQQGVIAPSEWLPKAKVESSEGNDEQRADYFPPEEPPNRTEHKTFELQTVKVDPYADPRTAPTQRKLRPPPRGPDSAPHSSQPSQMAIWLPIVLAILAFGVIVLFAILFRAKNTEEKGATPVIEPQTTAAATAAAQPAPQVEPTARVVSPPEPTVTETTPRPEVAPNPERPNKVQPRSSARPTSSKDPFGRAF